MTESIPKIEMWPVEDLIPYELNVKKHGVQQVSKIAASLRKSGFHQPIVVDRDGFIIAGHGRRLAAIELGLKKVPVWRRKDLFGDTSRAARLADNRVALSDTDTDMLKLELSTLEVDMSDIFDIKELDFISADMGAMNLDPFVTDMGAVLEGQKADIADKTAKAVGEDVRISLPRAFGFKDISASGALAITTLMGKAEAATGLRNDEALVTWARSFA